MTTPNYSDLSALDDFTDAANAIGLAAMQEMQAEDWIQAQIENITGSLGGIVSWVTDGMATIITDVQAYVTTGDTANLAAAAEFVQSKIAGLLDGVVTLVGDLLSALQGDYDGDDETLTAISDFMAGKWLSLAAKATQAALDALQNFVQQLIDAIVSALEGIPVVGKGLADIISRLGGLKSDVAATAAATSANTAAIADLSEIVGAARATQAWVGNYTDMASVPRVMVAPGMGVQSCSDAAHSHGMAALVPAVTKVTKSEGSIYFTPIIVDRQGDLDKFRFITGADSSLFSIDAYYIALMIYDIPNARFLTIWNPGNIKDSMGSSLSEVSLDMGLTGAAAALTPGQVLIAAHMQIAPGLAQTARSVTWVPQWGIARTPDVLLPGCYWKSNSTYSSIPSTFNVSAATPRNDGIPWYAVSVTND